MSIRRRPFLQPLAQVSGQLSQIGSGPPSKRKRQCNRTILRKISLSKTRRWWSHRVYTFRSRIITWRTWCATTMKKWPCTTSSSRKISSNDSSSTRSLSTWSWSTSTRWSIKVSGRSKRIRNYTSDVRQQLFPRRGIGSWSRCSERRIPYDKPLRTSR